MGVLFLVVVCVVGYFAWKIHRLARRRPHSDLLTAISVLPARDMELEPSSAREWKEQERLEYNESQLKRVGATHVGYFCVYSGYATIRVSMWHYRNQAVAVFYEGFSEADKDNVQFVYEVGCRLDGGSVCVTSNQHALAERRYQSVDISVLTPSLFSNFRLRPLSFTAAGASIMVVLPLPLLPPKTPV